MNTLETAGLVDVLSVDPTFRLDLRYATANNLAGRPVYPVARCYLLTAVAERLADVHRALARKGLGLILFDGYRPFQVQEVFFGIVPDERFIARPVREGNRLIDGSHHSRGAAIDLTLCDRQGRPLPMPSDFDAFGETAHRFYEGGSQEARLNRDLLQETMQAHGFMPLDSEWWHFSLPACHAAPLLDLPLN